MTEACELNNRYGGKRMLFLPGGQWQVPVIELAQAMGFEVICVDGTPDAPGFQVADEGLQVRLQDVDAVVAIAKSRNVDVVMSEQTDFAVPIVARVAHALGLRGLPVDVADAATHKGIMRTQAAQAGLRQPEFRLCATRDAALEAAIELGVPLFHKPVDGQSSRGVGLLSTDEPDEVAKAFQHSRSASILGEVIFENLLTGTECTVEGFVVAGEPTTLAVSDKEHYDDLPCVARTLTWPADFPEAVLERIACAHEAAARAIGIPFGLTHAEFMVDAAGEPWLVEIAARGGGSKIPSHIVPALCGFEPTPALIRTLMGETPAVQIEKRQAAQLRFLRLPEGQTIRSFVNLDELRSLPGVLDLRFEQQSGETVAAVTDDRSRHGYVITHAETRRAAVQLAEHVEQELVVEMDG